jgi:peptidyl-prolyl cis-trans isomerase C
MSPRFDRHRFGAVFLVAAVAFSGAAPACSGGGCGKSAEKSAVPPEVTAPGHGLTHGLTKEQADKVLVKVGDATITVGQFAQRLAALSPYLRARYNSPERRREFLENMVRFELLAIAAKEKGFDTAPEVQRTRNEVMVQKLMEQLFDGHDIKPVDVTEADVKAYYDAHQEEFSKPEQVRASHILIKNRATAERVLREAIAGGSDAEKFYALAKQYNEDADTMARFGDLRFFSRPEHKQPDEPDVADAVRTAAFSIGDIGGVHAQLVQTAAGFHIVKLTGKRAALNRPLDVARRLIQNRLWRERREQAIEKFIADLRAKANVEEHLEHLSQVKVDPPADGAGH